MRILQVLFGPLLSLQFLVSGVILFYYFVARVYELCPDLYLTGFTFLTSICPIHLTGSWAHSENGTSSSSDVFLSQFLCFDSSILTPVLEPLLSS